MTLPLEGLHQSEPADIRVLGARDRWRYGAHQMAPADYPPTDSAEDRGGTVTHPGRKA